MKRILALGCSHGTHIDPEIARAVIRFRNAFKPHTVLHIGDFVDLTAFRSGACGNKDETEPLQPDVDEGLAFLRELRPTHILCGNHEARAWRMRASHRAIEAYTGNAIVEAIEYQSRKLRAQLFPYNGVWQGLKLGGYTYMHGVMYGASATRDHAEAYGNVVHAHNHSPGMAVGRRADNPVGFGVGTLAKIRNMDYANTRRQTLAWGSGFVFGEYDEHRSYLQLWLLGPNESDPDAPVKLP